MNAFRSRYRSVVRPDEANGDGPDAGRRVRPIEDRYVVIRALRHLIAQQRAAIVLRALLG